MEPEYLLRAPLRLPALPLQLAPLELSPSELLPLENISSELLETLELLPLCDCASTTFATFPMAASGNGADPIRRMPNAPKRLPTLRVTPRLMALARNWLRFSAGNSATASPKALPTLASPCASKFAAVEVVCMLAPA